MHKQGTVVAWDAAKGIGFIRSPQTPEDVFFHVRDWEGLNPPAMQAPVAFEEIHVGGKGPRAMSVVPLEGPTVPKVSREALRREREDIRARATAKAQPPAPELPRAIARSPSAQARATRREQWLLGSLSVVFLLWLVLLLAGVWMRRMPWVVLPGLALLNIGAFFVHWKDKLAADEESVRIREEVLHGLALLGGWPAAWLAQQVLRHKADRIGFQVLFWVAVAVNLVALAAGVLWPVFNPEPPPPPPEPWN